MTNTEGFDIKGFMPASLDAKKQRQQDQERSSCDEDSICSDEICCIFDNNIEEQESKI